MSTLPLTENECSKLAETVLEHCYGVTGVNDQMIEQTTEVIVKCIQRLIVDRRKPVDNYKYLLSEDELRDEFEKQHAGRALDRSHRGTYRSPQIAAIWNQHFSTARIVEKLLREKLKNV